MLLWTVWTVRLLTLNAYTSLLRILSHSLSLLISPPHTHSLYIYVPELLHSNDSGKMLVVLRDGRKLHGVLRSYDQFGMSTSSFSPSLSLTHTHKIHSGVRSGGLASQPRSRRYSGAYISRKQLRWKLARFISHQGRKCRVTGWNRTLFPSRSLLLLHTSYLFSFLSCFFTNQTWWWIDRT